jgi:hypothetical protein
MSGLETRAARNVVIVATANKLARQFWPVEIRIIHGTKALFFPTRRSGALRFNPEKLCRRSGRRKTQSNDVPENLWCNEVVKTVAINKDMQRADHH